MSGFYGAHTQPHDESGELLSCEKQSVPGLPEENAKLLQCELRPVAGLPEENA